MSLAAPSIIVSASVTSSESSVISSEDKMVSMRPDIWAFAGRDGMSLERGSNEQRCAWSDWRQQRELVDNWKN
jgi:hypothetical protein